MDLLHLFFFKVVSGRPRPAACEQSRGRCPGVTAGENARRSEVGRTATRGGAGRSVGLGDDGLPAGVDLSGLRLTRITRIAFDLCHFCWAVMTVMVPVLSRTLASGLTSRFLAWA